MAENNVIDKVNRSELSADAKEFVPRNPVADSHQEEDSGVPYSTTDEISQTIAVLEAEPEAFDNMIEPLCDSLNYRVNAESQLIDIIDILVTQSSEKSNFQYIGARMCNYLSSHLALNFEGGNFRQFMLKKCHQVFKLLETEYNDTSRQSLLCGFSLFLAELIINMGEGMSAEPLINAVCRLVELLLTVHTEQTLLCVVKVLKLCGAVLDRHKNSRVDEIFALLKSCIVDDNSSKSVRMQCVNLVELRARDWGSERLQDTAQQDLENYDNSGFAPIYLPQLAVPDEIVDVSNYYASGDYNDTSLWSQDGYDPVMIDGTGEYYPQYGTDDGMDPEMELAYEEFLSQSQPH